ncbi:MAG: DNA repair protein RecO [Bacteroidota bacterium]|nr:DNA repair protein RecO [Bacteroidota bacterium]
MLHTKGIVFRQIRYKESSLIIHIYTEAEGLHSFIMNGVFKKGNQRNAALLQLMNFVDFISYFQETKSMHRIKEVNPEVIYTTIPFNIHRSAVGSFMLEVCRKCLKTAMPNPELYQFLKKSFVSLDTCEVLDANFPLKFLIEFSQMLGFSPLQNYSAENKLFDIRSAQFIESNQFDSIQLTEEDSQILFQLLQNNSVILKQAQRRRILDALILYYSFHMDHFGTVKSAEIFRAIF